jgi:hypothetical protein
MGGGNAPTSLLSAWRVAFFVHTQPQEHQPMVEMR